jgi:DNA-binding phage protein
MSDASPQLDTLEAIATHLASAFESGDTARITAALHDVANAPAADQLAAAAGFPSTALHDALRKGELPLDITLGLRKVIDLYR